jgi:NitT/TauT family transport system permease protein
MSLVVDRTTAFPVAARRRKTIRKASAGTSETLNTIWIGLPALFAFGLLWEIGPRAGWINALFFPPLSKMLAALRDMTQLAEHERAVVDDMIQSFIKRRNERERR